MLPTSRPAGEPTGLEPAAKKPRLSQADMQVVDPGRVCKNCAYHPWTFYSYCCRMCQWTSGAYHGPWCSNKFASQPLQ